MKTYSLVIAEHSEIGELGVEISGGLISRHYFDPAISGLQFAHDLIEHTIIPHECGYVDELLALGGVIAGRVENDWAYSSYANFLKIVDLAYDIESLINYDYDDRLLNVPRCRNYIQNQTLINSIQQFIRDGILAALKDTGEYENEEEMNSRLNLYDIESMTGWIVKGYQLWKKRFSSVDSYQVSVLMFNEISKLVDQFLNHSDEGDTAKLSIEFTTGKVYLETSN